MLVLHLIVVFILSDGINLLFRTSRSKLALHWQRLYGFGIIPLILFSCLMMYGRSNMNHVVETDYIVITDKAIREEGYRVAFLSDLHYGTVQDKAVLQSEISKINAQNPDIVILGGDIVEEGTSKEDMQDVFCYLGSLEAPLGVYFVYGNHDRQADADIRTYTDAELATAIKDNGIVILEDEGKLLDGALMLIGRADVGWNLDCPRKKISELVPDDGDNLFLLTVDHQPLELEENDAAGIDLMLSGHTHAGQLFPVGYVTELLGGLNYGIYYGRNCKSIVSSGFAGWGYEIRTQANCEYVIVDIIPE